MSRNLRLNATWNLDPMPAGDQESLAYLLLDITSDSTTIDEIQNSKLGIQNSLNLNLVLDTSGSMGGAKLQNLKTAVKWVLDYLGPEDTISVTFFDDEVHPLIPSTHMADAQDLASQIDAVREAGGTAMSRGLLVGLDEAMKGRAPGVVSRIIVLTDGQTWGDSDQCRKLAAQAGSEGIPITALGVGAEEDWSIELLDDMAQKSGGQSGYIARPEEISAAFEGTIVSMQQTIARNLRLTFNPSKGVGLRAVYRVAPMISKIWPATSADGSQHEGPLTLSLGDAEAGSAQTLLFEVLQPPRKPGQYRAAHLRLTYETAGGQPTQSELSASAANAKGNEEECILDLVANFSLNAKRGPGDPRVMNSVEKATTFKLQTRALQASMVGDVPNATKNLRAAATRFLNIGETELAEAAEQEAQLLETQGKMSAAGTKKLAFDTRRLAVSEMPGPESGVGSQESVVGE